MNNIKLPIDNPDKKPLVTKLWEFKKHAEEVLAVNAPSYLNSVENGAFDVLMDFYSGFRQLEVIKDTKQLRDGHYLVRMKDGVIAECFKLEEKK